MSQRKYWLALVVFGVVVSISAIALGRHHRPFGHAPVRAHIDPAKGRALALPAGKLVE